MPGINAGHRLAAEINAASMNVKSEKAKVKAVYAAYGIGQAKNAIVTDVLNAGRFYLLGKIEEGSLEYTY